MDYVYVCRSGDNEELRYSIRSVVKNLPEGTVWLIGYKPDWYQGNYIQLKDRSDKHENIRKCIKAITDSNEISDNFILMHDDFFILKPMDSVPTLHGGPLKLKIIDYAESRAGNRYLSLLKQTFQKLISMGIKEPLDYDIHIPRIMNKKILKTIIDIKLLPKSLYGNIANVGGEQIKDVKIYSGGVLSHRSHQISDDSFFVSTEDFSFKALHETVLKDMFTIPTKYEKK
jgi:hypothetical protein